MRAAVTCTFLAAVVAGCASSSLPPVRYRNAPAVERVNDRHDVARPPAEHDPPLLLYYYDGFFQRRISRALELRRSRRALGVNALDEVPDSTWFTNRIGVRDLTPDEVRAGATAIGSPEAHGPFTIHSAKTVGMSLGYVVSDRRGERYLFKFDERGVPETETATEVIVGRLMWAAGYNVPETHIIYLRAGDLRLGQGATTKDELEHKRPLTQRDIDAGLATIHQEPDGLIRVMASRMLEGKPLGGHPHEGVRQDDPNDLIPHELRRDLRGLYTLFAWLDQVDVKSHNTLDMWVTDPADPDRHYVKHYLLDFGKSLGTMVMTSHDLRRGHEYAIDFRAMFSYLVTLGLRPRPWESRDLPPLRGVGAYDVRTYQPGAWKPQGPMYAPFLLADRFDKLWGARIAIRFTRPQLRAAVEAARLTDPRAIEYLTDTLVARQRATARYWFGRVNPIDAVELVSTEAAPSLCFDDLLLTYDLSLGGTTRYTVTSHDRGARRVGEPQGLTAASSGRTCTAPLALAGDGDGYTIVRIETRRPTFTGATDVHVARAPGTGAYRVVGIWRP